MPLPPSEKVKLNRQLQDLSKHIDESITACEMQADLHNMDVHQMMTSDGKHFLAPLLLAKAEVLSAQVRLNVKE